MSRSGDYQLGCGSTIGSGKSSLNSLSNSGAIELFKETVTGKSNETGGSVFCGVSSQVGETIEEINAVELLFGDVYELSLKLLELCVVGSDVFCILGRIQRHGFELGDPVEDSSSYFQCSVLCLQVGDCIINILLGTNVTVDRSTQFCGNCKTSSVIPRSDQLGATGQTCQTFLKSGLVSVKVASSNGCDVVSIDYEGHG